MRSLISVVPVPARVPGVRERPASESQSQAELRDRNSQTVRQAGLELGWRGTTCEAFKALRDTLIRGW